MYQLDLRGNTATFSDDVRGLSLSLPAGQCLGMAQTAPIPPLTDPQQLIRAVRQPIQGPPLSQLARERQARSACVLVSDATRAVPTALVAPIVVEELQAGGVPLENITFFVAIGVHREATEEELRRFLGPLHGRVRIENHTPFDPDNLVVLGETSHHTPVEVNRRAYDCDLHIQIGKVEPHEFAGFSGGRKSVLPGIASQRTIITNHRPEMILDPRSAIGALSGNPVHEDMLEAALMFRIDFGVNFILNNQLEPAALFAGGMEASHQAAVDFVRQYLQVEIPAADIILTTPGQPLDIDFYQSVKALIALTECVDERTTIALYCDCAEGVSSPDMLRAFSSSDDLEQVVRFATENYCIQMDHVLLLAKILRRGARLVVSSPHVTAAELSAMFMTPCPDPSQLLAVAAQVSGKPNPSVLFYPCPQTGLPQLKR